MIILNLKEQKNNNFAQIKDTEWRKKIATLTT